MDIRYVAKTSDCWLRVKLEGGGILSVPYGLKVERIETKNRREYFRILEGVDVGKIASVQSDNDQGYLTTDVEHQPGAVIRFDRKKQSFHVGGRGPFNAFSGGGHAGFTPVVAGTYPLAIPAYPSAQTRPAYNAFCRYHNVWFRIGVATTGSRFLHAGAISEGCVTVRQFLYDPRKTKPPAGFGDLEKLAKTMPGLIGLPLPA
jgi:hypothetical protein